MGQLQSVYIQGSEKNGADVIKLLKSLGGVVEEGKELNGRLSDCVYFINHSDNCIDYVSKSSCVAANKKVYTLGEYRATFYETGNEIIYDGFPFVIQKSTWNFIEGAPIYKLNDDIYINHYEMSQKIYRKNINDPKTSGDEKEINGIINQITEDPISLDKSDPEKMQLIVNDGYELKIIDDTPYIIKKEIQWPTSYEECCKILRIPTDETYISVDLPLDFNKSIASFTELLICRNAYRELDDNWKSDSVDQVKYAITYKNKEIHYELCTGSDRIFSFSSIEVCEKFYNNFGILFNNCKELF